MTDFYLLSHLENRRLWVAEKAGGPVSDAVFSPVPARHGGLVEQIVIGRWDN